MKVYSLKDSLLFVVRKFFLADVDSCIQFLEEQGVLASGESDDIDSFELFDMAESEVKTLSVSELKHLVEVFDLFLGKGNFDILDIDAVANEINDNKENWVARCFEISSAIVNSDLVEGKAVFGKYYGKIHKDSFFNNSSFPNHGWILTKHNYIIDPTRWVFEATEPYIYIGEVDNPEYDRGSNILKSLLSPLSKAPSFDDSGRIIEIEDKEIEDILYQLFKDKKEPNKISINQALFIANTSLLDLDTSAKPIFQWLSDNGLKAFIPIDNYETVMNG